MNQRNLIRVLMSLTLLFFAFMSLTWGLNGRDPARWSVAMWCCLFWLKLDAIQQEIEKR